MGEIADIAAMASMLAVPARAAMLTALMDGRPHAASVLACRAGVAAPTASGHLGRLRHAGLVRLEQQGRRRLYRLANLEVARMIEAIGAVAARPSSRVPPALREARTCYDHLAGRLAVAVADAMQARGELRVGADGAELRPAGLRRLEALGIDPASAHRRRRAFCRACLDWTERRPHLGGAIGAALLATCLERGWVHRLPDTRAVRITPEGEAGLAAAFRL